MNLMLWHVTANRKCIRCSRDGAHRCGIAMVSGNIPCRVQIKNLQHLSVGSLEPQRLIETRAMKYSLLFLGQIVGCQAFLLTPFKINE
ncbi:uncharacterized protein [Lolium perenne]|uniref:uncharacterized protein isoform X3 n=1 Tax=Lolium perenne TaxID=4522 RepID=UPI003A98F352